MQVQTVSISYLRCLIEHVRCYILDRDIELVYYTIRKASDVLTRDPMQLGAQVWLWKILLCLLKWKEMEEKYLLKLIEIFFVLRVLLKHSAVFKKNKKCYKNSWSKVFPFILQVCYLQCKKPIEIVLRIFLRNNQFSLKHI